MNPQNMSLGHIDYFEQKSHTYSYAHACVHTYTN